MIMFYIKSKSRVKNLFLSIILFGCLVLSGLENPHSNNSNEITSNQKKEIVLNQNDLIQAKISIFRIEGWFDGKKGSRGYLFGWKIWDTY